MTEKMTQAEYHALFGAPKVTGTERVESAGKTVAKVKNYKAVLLQHITFAKLPMPTHGDRCAKPELVFHPIRKWRFDFAYIDQKVAIEYQGGTYHGKTGHSNVAGLERDYEKFTEAQLLGWIVIIVNVKTVQSGQAVTWIERALRVRQNNS